MAYIAGHARISMDHRSVTIATMELPRPVVRTLSK